MFPIPFPQLSNSFFTAQYFKENPLQLGASDRRSTGNKSKKKEKTDITERLKILAEFQGVQEHQQFMLNIVKEREMKSRAKDLIRYVIYHPP
jgi:hypothetical protein